MAVNKTRLSIQMSELTKAFEIVTTHFRQVHGDLIEINEDYYWEIGESQLYNPTSEPSEFSLGQLSHDLERLRQIVKSEAPAIGSSMEWLGAVLRAMGQKAAQ